MTTVKTKPKNYKSNLKEGLHLWLTKNVKDYKRNNLQHYISGFKFFINEENSNDNPELVSKNFKSWVKFIREKFSSEMIVTNKIISNSKKENNKKS